MKRGTLIQFILSLNIMFCGCNSLSNESYSESAHIDNMSKIKSLEKSGDYEGIIKIYDNDLSMIKQKSTKTYLDTCALLWGYEHRAYAKENIKDFTGQISDLSNLIELVESFKTTNNYRGCITLSYLGLYYKMRAMAKINLGGNGCEDLRKAAEEDRRAHPNIKTAGFPFEIRRYCN